jgi:hypothetical protein
MKSNLGWSERTLLIELGCLYYGSIYLYRKLFRANRATPSTLAWPAPTMGWPNSGGSGWRECCRAAVEERGSGEFGEGGAVGGQ